MTYPLLLLLMKKSYATQIGEESRHDLVILEPIYLAWDCNLNIENFAILFGQMSLAPLV